MQVLVVCTANIARSPLAEAMLARELGDGVQVTSAGTRAREGFAAAPESIELGEERGLDLRHHRSRPVSPAFVADADLILTMSERQRDAVAPLATRTAGRLFTLREFDRLTRAVDRNARQDTLDHPLRWWRDQAHLARPAAAPASGKEDIADPIGRPWDHWVRLGHQLDELVQALGDRLRA